MADITFVHGDKYIDC